MKKLISKSFGILLLFSLCTGFSYAQKKVSGKVVDKSGNSVPGASVLEKYTTNGVSTDFDGSFTLYLVSENAVLEISSVGFKTQEKQVLNASDVNIILIEDVAQLEEVVVIGYQTVKKSDVTGSVSKINTKELSEIPANSVEELLVGRVPGLVIGNPSDDPGAGLNVRIRGASSFTATTPLIVVDGFPLGDAGNLKQINPADIISVEVLKDASAAAIYGSRGANGVILVTTRRGKNAKMTVNLTTTATISDFASEFDLFKNPVHIATLTDEGRVNSGFPAIYVGGEDVNGTYFPSISEIREGYPTTDYIDYVFRKPINTNYNLSIYGGNKKTKYNFGLNLNTQNGVVRDNDLSKVTVSFGIDQKLNKKVSLSTNMNFSRGERNDNGWLSFDRNILFPMYNSDGTFYKANENDFANPVALTKLRVNDSKTLDLISTSVLLWEMTDNLKFKSQFNYSLGSSFRERYFPNEYTQLGAEGDGVAFNDNFQNQRVVVDAYVTYNKMFAEKHDVTLLAGYSSEYFEVRTSQLRSQGFINGSLGAGNLSLGRIQRTSNDFIENALSSAISRLNYTFDNRILLTFTGRLDGSSKFGANNRYAFFPSGAISWKLQKEKFIKGLPFLVHELKPRVSYGIVGNQAIGPFETLNKLGNRRYFTNGDFVTTVGPGIVSNNGIFVESRGLGNPDLKWETTKVFNVGLDFSALARPLRFSFDFYNKVTEDLLVDSTLPPTSGFDFLRINAGEIENQGIEVSLNYDFVRKEDFRISTGIIFNKNENKVISLGPAKGASVISDDLGNRFRFTGTNFRDQYRSRINVFAIDQPVNVFYGAVVKGIIQSEEEGLFNGFKGAAAKAGEFFYEDINGDGEIDPFGADRTIIGDPNPDFTASFTLDVSYKNWELAALFNGSFGGDVANINKFSTAGGGQASNLLKRWSTDNRSTEFPSLRENRNVAFSDWWIEDGSFVRIQNVRLGYNFKIKRRSKLIDAAKLYFSGDNLYNFTNYSGIDPEVNLQGTDQNRLPRLSRFTLGLEVAF